MKHDEISKWLKGITIVIGIMGMVFFFGIVPKLAYECKLIYPEVAYLFWPGLVYSWIIAVLCYMALYQFWSICCEIGKDNSFSKENSNSMVSISRLSLVIGVVWFAGIVILGLFNLLGPGFIILMVGATFIHIIISIMAAALSRLILKAYEMKLENELTI